MEERHPGFAGRTWNHALGRARYRAGELLSGRYVRDALDSTRLRGTRWSDIDWTAFGGRDGSRW
jgi:hypothetical protein